MSTDEAVDVADLAHKLSDGRLPVMEVFGPTMQGEGLLAGKRSYFIRLGGCSYRCSWCDSMHAVDPVLVKRDAEWMTPNELVEWLQELQRQNGVERETVTISGGDPCMYDLGKLVTMLRAADWKVAIETQGAFAPQWITEVDYLMISPKPPSSGMLGKYKREVIESLIKYHRRHSKRIGLKFVIDYTNPGDWLFAETVAKDWLSKYSHLELFLSALTPPNCTNAQINVVSSYEGMVKQSFKYPFLSRFATLLPQLHVLVWGHQKGV